MFYENKSWNIIDFSFGLSNNYFSTDNPMIMRAKEDMLSWDELETIIHELEIAIAESDQQSSF